MRKVLFIIGAVLLANSLAGAQSASQIRKIDAYVATVKRVSASTRNPKTIVADTAEYDSGKTHWQKFASEKVLEKFRDKTETYSIAYNWISKGKLVQTNFTDFSPSGDWAQYTFHYFWPDGTIAKVEAEMRTFMGDYIIKRDFYMDAKGKVIKKTTGYFDLTTRKPKKPNKDILGDENSGFAEITFYRTTDKLPFASLIGIK